MSALSEAQHKFSRLVPRLLNFCFDSGYEVKINEVLRTQAQADANAKSGAGISHSLHLSSLAIDIALYKLMDVDGYKKWVYLDKTEDYTSVGLFWESIGGTWGGHFNDGNHFSLAFGGYK